MLMIKKGKKLALLPGNDRRPADIFIRRWAVTLLLQDTTRARAATEPGHAMTIAYSNKMRGTADLINIILEKGRGGCNRSRENPGIAILA